jgi:chromosome segregation ATPase
MRRHNNLLADTKAGFKKWTHAFARTNNKSCSIYHLKRFLMQSRYDQQMASRSTYDLNQQYRDLEKDDLIRRLQEEIAQWKIKYENIAKMYAQLRKEHLELLSRVKDIQSKAQISREAVAEKDKLAESVRLKTMQLNEAMQESARWKMDTERMQESSRQEVAVLRRETAEAKAKFDELSKSKGSINF